MDDRIQPDYPDPLADTQPGRASPPLHQYQPIPIQNSVAKRGVGWGKRKKRLPGWLLLVVLLLGVYFFFPMRTNILFLGSDDSPSRGELGRTDAIILTTFNPARETIQFNQESDYSLDLEQFNAYFEFVEKNLRQESINSTSLLNQLEALVQLYRGEFLKQFFFSGSAEFEEWILAQREIMHQRLRNVLTILVDQYERQADYATARGFALRQLELDPWREEAHFQVMRLLALEGQRSAALAQYENSRKVLAKELGVEPSSQTRELYEQIRLGTLKHMSEQPTQLSSTPLHNLPVSLTPFIGREQEHPTSD